MCSVIRYSNLATISNQWDAIVQDYFQSTQFLNILETYNPCNQRYYALYECNCLMAGAIAYEFNVNLLTFSNKKFTIKTVIIGVPASVDSSGLVGNPGYFDKLVQSIIKSEKALVLSMNYESDLSNESLIQMEALPTLIINLQCDSIEEYIGGMRSNYRKRAVNARKNMQDISSITTSCQSFSDNHYKLYMNIMNRSKTKLETLTKDFFTNLPDNFQLTSLYHRDELLAWHITCPNKAYYSFLFGGLNYDLRDEYNSYYNNLLGIIEEGIDKGYKSINLGQTAEIPKMRVGAIIKRKRMFLYHRNACLRMIFMILKPYLEYNPKFTQLNVFKHTIEYTHTQSSMDYQSVAL